MKRKRHPKSDRLLVGLTTIALSSLFSKENVDAEVQLRTRQHRQHVRNGIDKPLLRICFGDKCRHNERTPKERNVDFDNLFIRSSSQTPSYPEIFIPSAVSTAPSFLVRDSPPLLSSFPTSELSATPTFDTTLLPSIKLSQNHSLIQSIYPSELPSITTLQPSSAPSIQPTEGGAETRSYAPSYTVPAILSSSDLDDQNTTISAGNGALNPAGHLNIDIVRPSNAPLIGPVVEEGPKKFQSSAPSLIPLIMAPSGDGAQKNVSAVGATNLNKGETTICAVDSLGFFGSVIGTPVDLTFFYEVVSTNNISLTVVNDEIVPLIEAELSNMMLPTLFEHQCSPVFTVKGRNSFRRRLEATGVSTSPADFVLRGVKCVESIQNDDDTCTVVKGQVSFFSAEGTDTQVILATARTIIREAMENGVLNNLQKNILVVTFRSEGGVASEFSKSGDSSLQQVQFKHHTTQFYVWVPICGFFAMINICFGLSYRYNRRRWKTIQKRTADHGEDYYDDGKYYLEESWTQMTLMNKLTRKRRSSVRAMSGSLGEASHSEEFLDEFAPIANKRLC